MGPSRVFIRTQRAHGPFARLYTDTARTWAFARLYTDTARAVRQRWRVIRISGVRVDSTSGCFNTTPDRPRARSSRAFPAARAPPVDAPRRATRRSTRAKRARSTRARASRDARRARATRDGARRATRANADRRRGIVNVRIRARDARRDGGGGRRARRGTTIDDGSRGRERKRSDGGRRTRTGGGDEG